MSARNWLLTLFAGVILLKMSSAAVYSPQLPCPDGSASLGPCNGASCGAFGGPTDVFCSTGNWACCRIAGGSVQRRSQAALPYAQFPTYTPTGVCRSGDGSVGPCNGFLCTQPGYFCWQETGECCPRGPYYRQPGGIATQCSVGMPNQPACILDADCGYGYLCMTPLSGGVCCPMAQCANGEFASAACFRGGTCGPGYGVYCESDRTHPVYHPYGLCCRAAPSF